jgi:hypothetical protein
MDFGTSLSEQVPLITAAGGKWVFDSNEAKNVDLSILRPRVSFTVNVKGTASTVIQESNPSFQSLVATR